MSARGGRFSAKIRHFSSRDAACLLLIRDRQAIMSKSEIAEYALGRRTLPATAAKHTPPPTWLRLPAESRQSPLSNSPAAILAHRPDDVGISAPDWSALLASDANAVVVGADPAIVRLWTAVWSTLRKPVCWVESGRLWLPPQLAGHVSASKCERPRPAGSGPFAGLARSGRPLDSRSGVHATTSVSRCRSRERFWTGSTIV